MSTASSTATAPGAPRLVVPSRVAAATEVAQQVGAAAIVLSGLPSVRWLGVAQPAGVLALVSAGEALLVAPADADGLRRALRRAEIGLDDLVAVEAGGLPLAAAQGLEGRSWVEVSALLAEARARKDPEELALIGATARLVDVGHAALRDAACEGATELELWSAARGAIEGVTGRPLHAIVDLMAGERTALVGLPPSRARVAANAPILFDLAPRYHGYWADSCATFACGTPSTGLRRLHDTARAALDVGIANARAGVRARHLDALVRARLAERGVDCPHHVGHGVGTAPQEEPWIKPDGRLTLEEGMVVALEPGAYRNGAGVRVEHLLAIEADGSRLLTSHSLSLT